MHVIGTHRPAEDRDPGVTVEVHRQRFAAGMTADIDAIAHGAQAQTHPTGVGMALMHDQQDRVG